MSCQQLLHQLQTLQKEVATLRSLIRDQRIIERPRGLGSVEREVKRAQWEKDREVLKRTNEAVQKLHNEIEDADKEELCIFRDIRRISRELIALSEKNEIMYHSPDALKERLELLSGGVVSISENEIKRMYSVHPKQITEEEKLHLKKMKEYSITEKGQGVESAPLVLVLPQKIVINKKEIIFSLRTLENDFWPVLKASEKIKLYMKNGLKRLFIFKDFVPGPNVINKKTGAVLENILDKQWGTQLTAFTSTSTKGSYIKNYEEQKSLVTQIFGPNSEIRADMYLSMIVHYLLTEELLFHWGRDGSMRLHETGIYGDPLRVSYYDNEFALISNDVDALADAGIGSSFVFTLPSSAEASEGRPST